MTEQIELLTKKLNAESDGALRARIIERLRPLLELTKDLDPISLALPEGNLSGVSTKVVASPSTLVRAIGEAAFAARRDQARLRFIDEFLKKVGGMD